MITAGEARLTFQNNRMVAHKLWASDNKKFLDSLTEEIISVATTESSIHVKYPEKIDFWEFREYMRTLGYSVFQTSGNSASIAW